MIKLKESKRYEDYTDTGNNSTKSKIIRKGKYGFICPHCNEMNEVDIDMDINTSATHSAGIRVFDPVLVITCTSCLNEWITHDQGIDPNMVKAIKLLSGLGFTTEFSCEGHFNCGEGDLVSLPYISFIDNSITKHNPPNGWVFAKFKDTQTVLKWNGPFISESEKEEAINNLYDWINIELC